MLKNLVLGLFLLGGLFLVYRLGGIAQTTNATTSSSPTSSSSTATTDSQVTWCINQIDSKIKCYDSVPFSSGDTALDTFKTLATREGNITFETKDSATEAGVFIDTINGISSHSNDTSAIYWHFWVNDKEITTGINTVTPKKLDHFTFIYGK